MVAALVLLGWLVHYIATLGPRNAAMDEPPAAPVALTQDQWRLAGEVAAWEERFREMEARGGNDPAMEGILTHAIGLQQELLRHKPHAGPEHSRRLERLEVALATLQARAGLERIAGLEQAAGEAPATPAARAALREALARLQVINRSAAAPRLKDFVRETRLALRLENAEASPLRATADAALDAAAAKHEDWPEALAAYEQARTALTEVNQRFPRTRYVDIGLLDRIMTEIASLEAAAAALEVDVREKGAAAAQVAGQSGLAVDLFQSAHERQVELNRRYPRSRFASTQRPMNWMPSGRPCWHRN